MEGGVGCFCFVGGWDGGCLLGLVLFDVCVCVCVGRGGGRLFPLQVNRWFILRVTVKTSFVYVTVITNAFLMPLCLFGRKATLNWNFFSELRSCVKDEVDALGSPSLIVRMVSVDVKQHCSKRNDTETLQSSEAVWKSRWTSNSFITVGRFSGAADPYGLWT